MLNSAHRNSFAALGLWASIVLTFRTWALDIYICTYTHLYYMERITLCREQVDETRLLRPWNYEAAWAWSVVTLAKQLVISRNLPRTCLIALPMLMRKTLTHSLANALKPKVDYLTTLAEDSTRWLVVHVERCLLFHLNNNCCLGVALPRFGSRKLRKLYHSGEQITHYRRAWQYEITCGASMILCGPSIFISGPYLIMHWIQINQILEHTWS